MGATLSRSTAPSHATVGQSVPPSRKKLRVLCLHGWRTSGYILSCQTAAMQYHTDLEMVFLTAPFAAVGEPDEGIATFYPDLPYFEWFIRNQEQTLPQRAVSDEKESVGDNDVVDVQGNPRATVARYGGLDVSISMIVEALQTQGPFDGLLGFSQGASMVTRLAYINAVQNQCAKETSSSSSFPSAVGETYHPARFPSVLGLFRFTILIGGVPPEELQACICSSLAVPSLHIHGAADQYLNLSESLANMYLASERTVLVHSEGHNIPSIRTNLYDKINDWLMKKIKIMG